MSRVSRLKSRVSRLVARVIDNEEEEQDPIMAKVLIPLANGFEEVEAVTVIDVLRRGGVEVVTASIHGSVEVTGAHGIALKADALFSDAVDDDYEAVLLPGGGEGTENLKRSQDVLSRLRLQKERGGLLCAICAAPTVLEAAEVLDEGISVTCYPTCQMDLNRPWTNQPVVEHANVITAQGPGTSLLFGLVVLKALTDEAVAQKVARGMVADCF